MLKDNGALREIDLGHNRLQFDSVACITSALKVRFCTRCEPVFFRSATTPWAIRGCTLGGGGS